MGRSLTLRCLWWVVFTMTCGLGAEKTTSHQKDTTPPKLTVNIYNHAGASSRTLATAQQEATRILRHAGIETAWAGCPIEQEQMPQFPTCKRAGPSSLVVRIIPRSMARPRPSNAAAFGVALIPKDGSVAVFASVYIEAAAAIAGDHKLFGARMLGHLMAHEVGHLLLGQQSHSEKGIMRGSWLDGDIEKAAQGRLLFTERQMKTIQGAVRKRSKHSGSDETPPLQVGRRAGKR